MRRLRWVEVWLQRGVAHQLAIIGGLIFVVSLIGGVLAWIFGPEGYGFSASAWWAFLRLTDPGYLGDDEGFGLRVVSTVVTVLGYMLFMGSLVAILTQWLSRTLRHLEAGHTPIAMRNHIVVLGWTNRTSDVVAELASGRGRLKRFLESRGASRLRVVVVAAELTSEHRVTLREELGEAWDEKTFFLRSGSSLRPEHLERLALPEAAAIIVPGADFAHGGAELTDTRVVKTMLSIEAHLSKKDGSRRPHIVAELFDLAKVPIAEASVSGDVEVLASNALIGRLLVQALRERAIWSVYHELLTHRIGSSLFVRPYPELVGQNPLALHRAFAQAIPIGRVQRVGNRFRADLDPGTDTPIAAGDLLILLARNYRDTDLAGGPLPAEGSVERLPMPSAAAEPPERRVLVLGWSHKLPAILRELDGQARERFALTVISRADPELRETKTRAKRLKRVKLEHRVGDYTDPDLLARADPGAFDDVLLLASDWRNTGEESDARTVLGLTLLRHLLRDQGQRPGAVVELLDADNRHLFSDPEEAVVVSPLLIGQMIAHVAMRRELHAVYDALLRAGGPDIRLRSVADLGLSIGSKVDFAEIQDKAFARGAVALGVEMGHEMRLNPARDEALEIGLDARVVLLEGGAPAA